MECVALRAASDLCMLLLQKPHQKSKARDHTVCLERRMKLWKDGEIDELRREGRTIQGRLRSGKSWKSASDITRTFTNLMLQGRVASAMRVISEESTGVLELDANLSEGKTVREILKEKHPEGADAEFESLLRPDEGPTAPHRHL